MKRLFSIGSPLALLAVLALSACVSAPAATTTGVGAAAAAPATSTGVVASINSFTTADLSNAIAIATKSGTPTGQIDATCLTFVQGQLTTLQTTGAIPTGTVGVATAFVSADLAASSVSTATSPATQAAYATACGPMILQLTNQGVTLSTQITNLLGLLVKVP